MCVTLMVFCLCVYDPVCSLHTSIAHVLWTSHMMDQFIIRGLSLYHLHYYGGDQYILVQVDWCVNIK